MHEFPAKLECRFGNEVLPALIKRMGYRIELTGTAERLLPTTETIPAKRTNNNREKKVQHVAPGSVQVFSIDVPERR
jgi:hypothetical protein